MILLSFDIEEFDVPLEHGIEVPFEQQMAVSIEGTRKILACLKRHQIHATFFCTANFAAHAPEIIENILQDGHEIASHGYYHSSFEMEDLKRSREFLEQQTGQPVKGFRMARMMPIDEKEIKKEFGYNDIINAVLWDQASIGFVLFFEKNQHMYPLLPEELKFCRLFSCRILRTSRVYYLLH